MTWRHLALAATVVSLSGASLASASLTIDTTASATSTIGGFGDPGTATYGQTFTVPAVETRLDSFSVFINDRLDPDFLTFEFHMAAWDGFRAVGPLLYSSGAVTSDNNGGADGLEQFTFLPDLTLTGGLSYVAFGSASNYIGGDQGKGDWQHSPANVYPGGEFVFLNNGTDFAQLTDGSTVWSTFGNSDLGFVATFSDPNAVVVPEAHAAAIWTLLSLGAAGWFGRRRKGVMR